MRMPCLARTIVAALSCGLITLVLTTDVAAQQETQQPAKNPALDKMIGTLAFYSGFDGQVDAEITPGPASPTSASWQQWTAASNPDPYRPGLFGKALATGKFSLNYELGKGTGLGQTGAVAVWISAEQLQHGDVSYYFVVRLIGGDRSLLMGRMGNPLNKETVYAHLKIGEQSTSVTAGSSKDWQPGQWHLLIMNWGQGWIEFSVDGGTPSRQSLKQEVGAASDEVVRLTVSSELERDLFLLDELLVFSAPLSTEDVKWLFENKPPAAQ